MSQDRLSPLGGHLFQEFQVCQVNHFLQGGLRALVAPEVQMVLLVREGQETLEFLSSEIL